MSQIKEVMELVCAPKYLEEGESFKEGMSRIADTLKDSDEHFKICQEILLDQRFLPAGRVQASIGAARQTTAFNCYVSDTIDDSMSGIMKRLGEAAQTMRLGGGDGFDFSTLRPKNSLIKSLNSFSSGPISFMGMWDAMCQTIKSAGHRRGAMMAVLRVDHPDIEEFITCKQQPGVLTNFNISVGITDEFMRAVKNDEFFNLKFGGQVYRTVKAKYLWNKIMRNTWDHAEPGVLFIDKINQKNNLHYCETIAATNPCLHPDSLVETVDGRVRIADITEPTMVYTMLADGSLGIKKATSSWVSKKDTRVIKITTRNGKSIRVTPDHKIAVKNTMGVYWVRAKDLELGQTLVQLCRSRRGLAYSGVKLTTEDNRAYRMEHRMVAGAVYGIEDYHDAHHIDGNTYNNCKDNLQVLSHYEHARYTALFDNPQSHQEKCDKGMFVSTGITPRTVIPMPEELRSNMKNNYSCAVVSIEEETETTDVYDLTVEDTHNFIADFTVVHNCGEQPLPPNGACLLGSFNLVKYCKFTKELGDEVPMPYFDMNQMLADIAPIVRMMDNVIDNTIYPLDAQEIEAKNKRRMGLGITGLANAISFLGYEYGDEDSLTFTEKVMELLRDCAYLASIDLAKEKGPFPAFSSVEYGESKFIKTLPLDIQAMISEYGIRNSHLTSIAPTGTISLWAENISSGIEPVFANSYYRTVFMPDGSQKKFYLEDYAYYNWGIKGKTSSDISAKAHIDMLCIASQYVDSACSKTANVGDEVNFTEFGELYMMAYDGDASGCTTFRPKALEEKFAGDRGAVLEINKDDQAPDKREPEVKEALEGQACFIDPITGERQCAD